MRSSRPSSRSACSRTSSGMPASSIFLRYSSMTEPSSSPSSLRIDSICLRRKYSRCCFCAPDSTSSRMRRRTCSSASRSRWSAIASSSRSTTSTRLEQLDALLEAQVGRVGARVGERAGLGDRAQELADARGRRRRSSRISSTTARYSVSSSRVLTGGGVSSGRSSTSTYRRPSAPRLGGAEHARGAGRSRVDDGAAAGQAADSRRPRRPCRRSRTSPSCRGTSSTCVSPPRSSGRLTVMFGKTTVSSRGMSSNFSMVGFTLLS